MLEVISSFVKLHKQSKSNNQLNRPTFDFLQPLRKWLDSLEIHNRKLAHFIAKLIPADCPFERDIILLGCKLAHIPPLCKMNPLYEQFVSLRFKALCYLVDQCGEDIQSYC
ncbi:MAG: Mo-dependent nitrogenase C-terminal domain-containing protein [Cyanobacteria bacterium J06636_27]